MRPHILIPSCPFILPQHHHQDYSNFEKELGILKGISMYKNFFFKVFKDLRESHQKQLGPSQEYLHALSSLNSALIFLFLFQTTNRCSAYSTTHRALSCPRFHCPPLATHVALGLPTGQVQVDFGTSRVILFHCPPPVGVTETHTLFFSLISNGKQLDETLIIYECIHIFRANNRFSEIMQFKAI